jgi:hypothetical protein
VFIVLWLLGTEVLPNLHLASHQHDHTHAHDGTLVAHDEPDDGDDERERLHQLAHEQSGRPCAHKRRKPNELAFDRAPRGHAAAGISHHATALLDPLPPITTPVASPHVEIWRYAEATDRITSAHAARPSARGPPIA